MNEDLGFFGNSIRLWFIDLVFCINRSDSTNIVGSFFYAKIFCFGVIIIKTDDGYMKASNGFKICEVIYENNQIFLEFKHGKKQCKLTLDEMNSKAYEKASKIIKNRESQDVDFH